MLDITKIDLLINTLLDEVPNFIETDYCDNEDGTYTMVVNFEHPGRDSEYFNEDYISTKVTFDNDFHIIKKETTVEYKEEEEM